MKKFWKTYGFALVSWGITFLLVGGIFGAALWWTQTSACASAPSEEPTAKPQEAAPENIALPPASISASMNGIERKIALKTRIPEDRPNYDVTEYTVARGDSIYSIANEFGLKPETVLWANYDILHDTPDSLRVGQELKIPPVDGIYYEWKEGDTLEKVADEFKAKPEEILTFPGNHLDLTDPEIKPGEWVMIPGGKREMVQWVIPVVARGQSGTAAISGNACGAGGAIGTGYFQWPADNHYLSGNDFWSGHLGIDIADGEGGAVYAADSGVVTMAQGGWNYGYGNVIMIDHGNGFVTLYAHLSQINVSRCQSVAKGQLIGLAGNTGNSFGAHLHFEIRFNGEFYNPWRWLPPP